MHTITASLGDLTSIALERCCQGDKGFEFEQFAQALCRCKFGENFFATSPFKDGGVDGFITKIQDEYVISQAGKPEIIFQFGTTDSYLKKIEDTVTTLRKASINVKRLYYFSPQSISNIVEKSFGLETSLDISLTIFHKDTLVTMAANGECEKAFGKLVASTLTNLQPNEQKNLQLDYPSLYMHILYHHDYGHQDNNIISKITDSLIIWALRDTDPDKHIFLDETQIYQNIEKVFPSAKHSIKSQFRERLSYLTKSRTGLKQQTVQFHKRKGYCLPLETRKDYQTLETNSNNILLLTENSFRKRLESYEYDDAKKLQELITLMLYTIKELFEHNGMHFVEILKNSDMTSILQLNLSSAISKAEIELTQYQYTQSNKLHLIEIIQQVFFKPTEVEQEYLKSASNLYIMHYLMKNDIKLAEFIRTKTDNLEILVNTDIIILALSEYYLPPEGQQYRKLLLWLKATNAKLFITEYSLTEIISHLKIATYEYINHLQPYEKHITHDIVRLFPKILNRAYLYNKLEGKVLSWPNFIENFISYESLSISNNAITQTAKEELRLYLHHTFGLTYLDKEDIHNNVDSTKANQLKEIIVPEKKAPELAESIAYTALYIIKKRHINHELEQNATGFKTHWMTNERKSYSSVKHFLEKNGYNSRYVIRPEYVLYQLMMAPDNKSISESYSSTFPSALGIQLSTHINPALFHEIMHQLKDLREKDEGRAIAIFNQVMQKASEKSAELYYSDFEDNDIINTEYERDLSKWQEVVQEIFASFNT